MPGRAVADDLLAVAPELDQQLEQRALRLLDVVGELRSAPVAEALRRLPRRQLRDRGATARGPPTACARVDAERAAVARELLDVDDGEAVRGEDRRDRREREVGEVLVVDRVVLQRPRAAARGAGTRSVAVPSGASRIATPPTKSLMSGTCASTLLPRTRSARRPSRDEPLARARRRRTRRASARRAPRPPRRRSPPGRSRAPGCPSAGSAGAGSRRSRRARRRGCRGSSSSRSVIMSTYRRECSTHESEYAEKYAYSVKISSGGTNAGSCASQHSCRRGRGAGRTAPSPRRWSAGEEALAERRLPEVDHRQLERRRAEATVRATRPHVGLPHQWHGLTLVVPLPAHHTTIGQSFPA